MSSGNSKAKNVLLELSKLILKPNLKPKSKLKPKNKKIEIEPELTSLSMISQKKIFNELRKIGGIKQRSPEWYSIRETLITASSAASILKKTAVVCGAYIKNYKLTNFILDRSCCNPYSSKTEFILGKCGMNKFTGNIATRWGQKYEQVASDIYSFKTNSRIEEFGLLIHPKYTWLGASPDGITHEGVMLEIKCPFRRKITGVPPFYYWVQCQLQLEVCNLERCDFEECKFSEFKTESDFDSSEKEKGIFMEYINEFNEKDYFYPPTDIYFNSSGIAGQALKEWFLEKMYDLPSELRRGIRPIYWALEHYSVTTIYRNQAWFEGVKEDLHNAQLEIEEYKQNSDKLNQLIKESKSNDPDQEFIDIDLGDKVFSTPDAVTKDLGCMLQTDSEEDDSYQLRC